MGVCLLTDLELVYLCVEKTAEGTLEHRRDGVHVETGHHALRSLFQSGHALPHGLYLGVFDVAGKAIQRVLDVSSWVVVFDARGVCLAAEREVVDREAVVDVETFLRCQHNDVLKIESRDVKVPRNPIQL